MRLKRSGENELRIEFGDHAEFLKISALCGIEELNYPDSLHDCLPFGSDCTTNEVTVYLFNDSVVRERISLFMMKLEQNYGLKIDDDMRETLQGWIVPRKKIPDMFDERTGPATRIKSVTCTGCPYAKTILSGDCKAFLMFGEKVCISKGV